MRGITFSEIAWQEYVEYQVGNKQLLKKINNLIKDIIRNPEDGIGKPELLTNCGGSVWSRRIDEKNRLVYRINESRIEIIQCKNHYNDN